MLVWAISYHSVFILADPLIIIPAKTPPYRPVYRGTSKKKHKMALRARRDENKKAHTGVAVWALSLSRYRAGGLLL